MKLSKSFCFYWFRRSEKWFRRKCLKHEPLNGSVANGENIFSVINLEMIILYDFLLIHSVNSKQRKNHWYACIKNKLVKEHLNSVKWRKRKNEIIIFTSFKKICVTNMKWLIGWLYFTSRIVLQSSPAQLIAGYLLPTTGYLLHQQTVFVYIKLQKRLQSRSTVTFTTYKTIWSRANEFLKIKKKNFSSLTVAVAVAVTMTVDIYIFYMESRAHAAHTNLIGLWSHWYIKYTLSPIQINEWKNTRRLAHCVVCAISFHIEHG